MKKQRILLTLAFLVKNTRKSIQSISQKHIVKTNMLIYYCYEKNAEDTRFLSKISTYSCMITHYIMQKNIFVVIVYKLLEQQKHWNVILKKTALKLKINKGLRWQKKVNTLHSKIMK